MQVFLIPEDRVAIFGDACGEMTLLAKEMLPTYVAALRHLQVYQDQFDTVLRNHGAFWSDKRILQDNLELAEDIIAGRDAAAPLKMMGFRVFRGDRRTPRKIRKYILHRSTKCQLVAGI